jgi:precorrin-6x reductase
MLLDQCKQEGLHYITFRREKRHRRWTYVNEAAEIVELFRPIA